MRTSIRVAVIGLGRWGENLVRVLQAEPGCELLYLCDRSAERRAALARQYPGVRTAEDLSLALCDPSLQAVFVATPAGAHYAQARLALEAGKAVFVEKPLTTCLREARDLADLAARRQRVLMVGYIYLYHPFVPVLRQLIARLGLGERFSIYARRLNQGPVRDDVHVAWDLACHDIALALYLKKCPVVEVSAHAESVLHPGVPDFVEMSLHFADETVANLEVGWIHDRKVRQFVVAGEDLAIRFDELNAEQPLAVTWVNPRDGADPATPPRALPTVPALPATEPLRLECQAFLEAVRQAKPPVADARSGVEVVRVLEAIDRSIVESSRVVAV
jgi:predicted dehydrogenase